MDFNFPLMFVHGQYNPHISKYFFNDLIIFNIYFTDFVNFHFVRIDSIQMYLSHKYKRGSLILVSIPYTHYKISVSCFMQSLALYITG